jgi:hypothetical protein
MVSKITMIDPVTPDRESVWAFIDPQRPTDTEKETDRSIMYACVLCIQTAETALRVGLAIES